MRESRRIRRRELIGAGIGVASALLAGCLDDDDDRRPTTEEPEEIDPALDLDGKALSSAFPIELVEPESGDRIVNIHWHGEGYSHWHFGPLQIPLDGERTVAAHFNDRDGEPIPLGAGETYRMAITRTEETSTDLFAFEVDGTLVEFRGGSPGEGELYCHLERDGEIVWTAPPLPTLVK